MITFFVYVENIFMSNVIFIKECKISFVFIKWVKNVGSDTDLVKLLCYRTNFGHKAVVIKFTYKTTQKKCLTESTSRTSRERSDQLSGKFRKF